MIRETARIYTDRLGKQLEIKDYAIIYEHVSLEDNVIIGEHAVLGRSASPTSVVKKEFSKERETYISSGVSICSNVIIYEDVKIGRDSLIGDNSSIMPKVRIGDEVLISRGVTINTDVDIDSYTRVMDNSHITGRVKIGSHVFISVGVTMANDNLFGRNGYDDKVFGAEIGDYVSIGVGAIILPGIKIGKGSIVAAGSVVKKDVPEHVIVAGNPAKVVSKVPASLSRYVQE
ncbi:acyltransferase [Paenibacillus contaminans]|nr:acyltransferase [Paenibacillus contaminans]